MAFPALATHVANIRSMHSLVVAKPVIRFSQVAVSLAAQVSVPLVLFVPAPSTKCRIARSRRIETATLAATIRAAHAAQVIRISLVAVMALQVAAPRVILVPAPSTKCRIARSHRIETAPTVLFVLIPIIKYRIARLLRIETVVDAGKIVRRKKVFLRSAPANLDTRLVTVTFLRLTVMTAILALRSTMIATHRLL